ncbi:MAG TPA: hypothetical protein VMB50_17210 [Myxococcales bacterium]|nr:hypothetical protein [Myxococcales bacterium]
MRQLALRSAALAVCLLACGGSPPPVEDSGGHGTSSSGGRTAGATSGGLSGTGSSAGAGSTGGTTGAQGTGGSSSGGATGSCPLVWAGATRSFGPSVALSADPASSIVAPLFLPSGLLRIVVLEPGVPDLALADPAGQAQRLDSALFPGTSDTPQVQQPLDGSSGLVLFDAASAVSYVGSDGSAHGPFGLANAGITGFLSSLPLEGGAGGLLLGTGAAGLAWATVGSGGITPLTVIPLGIAGVQSVAATLWDDGQSGVWALFQASYGSSTALEAAHGGGTPFTFNAPQRLDALDPGELLGFEAVLGPQGQLGVLLTEGSSANPTLAGYALSTAGAMTGGFVETLPAPLALPTAPAASPWGTCGGQMSCDPVVRFDASGDLMAAWTLQGELSVARLAVGASAWPTHAEVAGGPLVTPLAVDAAGDASALAGSMGSYTLLTAPATGLPLQTALDVAALTNPMLAAATSDGSGAFWGTSSAEAGDILGWSYGPSGSPQEVTPVVLSGGEQVAGLLLAAGPVAAASLELSYPSALGASFSGAAGPGWAVIEGSLSSGGTDLLLSSYDPSTAVLGLPVSVALSGWQSNTGASLDGVDVDPAGDALVAFSQSVGNAAPNLYVVSAPPGGPPPAACAPLPLVANPGPFAIAADLAGADSRIVCERVSPATVAVAQ